MATSPAAFEGFDRHELVKLVLEGLHALGYSGAVSKLEEEASVQLFHPHVSDLRRHILAGEWKKACDLVSTLVDSEEDGRRLQCRILELKLLELVLNGGVKDALKCLRAEITPIWTDAPEQLHALASALVCRSVATMERIEHVRQPLRGRDSVFAGMRAQLAAPYRVPVGRLESLIQKSVAMEQSQKLFHAADPRKSLLMAPENSPQYRLKQLRSLKDHTDEVWCVRFSNTGRYLATASRDETIAIYDVEELLQSDEASPVILHGHTDEISCLSWSPDDSILLSCADVIKMWNPRSGDCLRTCVKHTKGVESVLWCPDGRHFFSGSAEEENRGSGMLVKWSVNGEICDLLDHIRVQDMALAFGGTQLLVIDPNKGLLQFPIHHDFEKPVVISESRLYMSMCVSKDGMQCVINTSSGGDIELWDLQRRQVVCMLHGQQNVLWSLRSCFLGDAQRPFVACGDDDASIFVWDSTGKQIQRLTGHCGVVNMVASHPQRPFLFASASDDHTVGIWDAVPADDAS